MRLSRLRALPLITLFTVALAGLPRAEVSAGVAEAPGVSPTLPVVDPVQGADGALVQKEMGVEIVDAEDGGHGFSARRGRRHRADRRRRS